MRKRSNNGSRYFAIYQDVDDCHETYLELDQAFARILAHCRYEPVWTEEETRVTLQFRFQDGPWKGQIVANQPLTPQPELFEAPNTFGAHVSRNKIMRDILGVGLKGWYGDTMELYTIKHNMVLGKLRAGRVKS
ncbi:MAG: hypothetical protein WCA81_03020 [Rhizomicrobium sp.]